jgi:tetratricopeptide (TPR) repeat protein
MVFVLLFSLLFLSTPGETGQADRSVRERAMQPYRQGLQHLRAESWAEAATAFQAAIDIDDAFELAYYGLGRACMPQRKFVEAAAALTRSRDLFQAQAGRHFSDQHEAQRYRRDRLLEIDETIRQYQTGAQTMRTQEAIRQLQEQRRNVQERFDRGMTVTIENSVPGYVSLALGSAFFRMGRLNDAEREYKAAVAADGRLGEAHSNLAVVYLEQGRIADAGRSITAAEKAGFRVNPQLKDDISAAARSGKR